MRTHKRLVDILRGDAADSRRADEARSAGRRRRRDQGLRARALRGRGTMKGLIGQKIGMARVFDDSGQPRACDRACARGRAWCCRCKRRGPRRLSAPRSSATSKRWSEPGASQSSPTQRPSGQGRMRRRCGWFASFRIVRMTRSLSWAIALTVDAVSPDVNKVDVTGHVQGPWLPGRHKAPRTSKVAPAGHGSMFHRAPGAIGQAVVAVARLQGSSEMPGQMGNKRDTQQALRIVKIDVDRGLILVKGSVPGAPNSYVTIRPAVRG